MDYEYHPHNALKDTSKVMSQELVIGWICYLQEGGSVGFKPWSGG